tara:strand:- start:169 stop:801 length:633 start_codon:yes stop_codon:yes gene_type:complete
MSTRESLDKLKELRKKRDVQGKIDELSRRLGRRLPKNPESYLRQNNFDVEKTIDAINSEQMDATIDAYIAMDGRETTDTELSETELSDPDSPFGSPRDETSRQETVENKSPFSSDIYRMKGQILTLETKLDDLRIEVDDISDVLDDIGNKFNIENKKPGVVHGYDGGGKTKKRKNTKKRGKTKKKRNTKRKKTKKRKNTKKKRNKKLNLI